MAQRVRNFWIETNVDGRASKDGTGPNSKDGGFTSQLFIRDHGSVRLAVEITGRPSRDGSRVILTVEAAKGVDRDRLFNEDYESTTGAGFEIVCER
jgi:hypothetical protein